MADIIASSIQAVNWRGILTPAASRQQSARAGVKICFTLVVVLNALVVLGANLLRLRRELQDQLRKRR
jgi:hypothetical protein